MNTDTMKTSGEITNLELPLAAPDPPEQEDEGHGEEQAQADQAQSHDGVTSDATILKYRDNIKCDHQWP